MLSRFHRTLTQSLICVFAAMSALAAAAEGQECRLLLDSCTPRPQTDPQLPPPTTPGTASDYRVRGDGYFRKGEYDLAIADYTQAINMDPYDNLAFHNRGFSYIQKGLFTQAMTDLDRTIVLNPRYDDAYYRRGFIYEHSGEYDRAIKEYSAAINAFPAAGYYEARAHVHHRKGDYRRAIADYDLALEHYPNLPSAINGRSLAQRNLPLP
jgi:tetratricopeptide (TPR) repeat protein